MLRRLLLVSVTALLPASIEAQIAGSNQKTTPGITKSHVTSPDPPPPPPPPSPPLPPTTTVPPVKPPPDEDKEPAPTILYLGATELTMDGIAGTRTAASYSFPLKFYYDARPWATRVVTTTGSGWLSVTPESGSSDRTLTISCAVGNLKAGTYTGKVIVDASDAKDSPKTIAVTFRVRDPIATTVLLSPNNATFTTVEGGPKPQPVKVTLQQQGEVILDWTVTSTTFNGGNWLTQTPNKGRDEGTLTLEANTANLAAGTYAGRVTVSSPNAVNNPITLNVVLTVGRQKASTGGQAYHAATSKVGPISPGQLITLAGTRLGPKNPAIGAFNQATQSFPTELGGTKVLFDKQPVPLLYVSENQINLQVPASFPSGTSNVAVSVEPGSFDPEAFNLAMKLTAPGIFMVDGKRAAALNQDNSVNSAATPADPGSIVQLFLTGQGMTNPVVPAGRAAPITEPFALPLAPVSATLNGKPVKLLFAGLAPGAVGLMQVNFEIPSDTVDSNSAEVAVTIGGVVSPAATISIGKKPVITPFVP